MLILTFFNNINEEEVALSSLILYFCKNFEYWEELSP